jgi:hypothetical protein
LSSTTTSFFEILRPPLCFLHGSTGDPLGSVFLVLHIPLGFTPSDDQNPQTWQPPVDVLNQTGNGQVGAVENEGFAWFAFSTSTTRLPFQQEVVCFGRPLAARMRWYELPLRWNPGGRRARKDLIQALPDQRANGRRMELFPHVGLPSLPDGRGVPSILIG